MIVCVCHRVSDRDIEHAVNHGGCQSFEELQDATRCGTGCGACLECAEETFSAAMACRPAAARVIPIAPALPATAQPVPAAQPSPLAA